MPPQIKHDINRSGWETTDFPSVCENCLPENPYVQMLKEDYAAECKICTRPMTNFRWKPDRTSRTKRTNICLTCARLKNCCQCCMLDLSFGLPIVVRDAALKMVAPGPQSSINREYYAQEHEKEIEEGRGAVEEYEKTDEKARELLRRLANSEPYYRKQRRIEAPGEGSEGGQQQLAITSAGGDGESSTMTSRRPAYGPAPGTSTPGPVRSSDLRRGRGGRGGNRSRPFPSVAQLPPGPQDIQPPADKKITSLFVTGIEDDLPEHMLRTFFAPFGTIRSLICSHRAHCAFVNYADRESAEKAAAECKGRAVVNGVPLRVQWGKPKPLDNLDREERLKNARAGRTLSAAQAAGGQRKAIGGAPAAGGEGEVQQGKAQFAVAPPPGAEKVAYSSLQGD
ncbi:Pre-mRNA-splicing factor slt11 [Ascosphaera atra]|nr:Pre-mRNA-splicing factor slt11 [Ascosphaera atra]